MTLEKQAKQLSIDIRKEVIRQGRWATCTNCSHWGDRTTFEGDKMIVTQLCSKYNIVPPAAVIVVGCAKHDSEVPF